jgi:hypothetical protein
VAAATGFLARGTGRESPLASRSQAVVLDSFLGSGTTLHESAPLNLWNQSQIFRDDSVREQEELMDKIIPRRRGLWRSMCVGG